ncbi:hypothetical protein C0993_008241 [Termitomyces sp. T159_Od127]|nr:hypothetical protein C0993_008241 [Termitomyces sp. T159_Od127]
MVKYRNNFGAEWLAPFANNFAPFAPSFDEELEALLVGEESLVQDVAKESKADVQWHIANSLEALACEGLGLGEATGAGKGSWQGQEEEEEEEGAKETTLNTMAGAAMGAAMPAARKAPTGGAKGLALPAKKGSPTKPSSKCRDHLAPRYKVPMQQDFSNKELARLLVPRWAEAVVDMGVEAGVVLKETKEKATVDLAMCQAFKEERKVCNKCWADNNPEGCWYSVGAPPLFQVHGHEEAIAKTQKCGNAPDSMVEKTYQHVVLVRRARAVMKKAWKAEA